MRTTLRATVLALALALGAPAFAADNGSDANELETLRSAVRADKRAYVAKALQLSDAEARKFWPIYDQYQRARQGSDERRTRAIVDLVGRSEPLSDAYVRSFMNEVTFADDQEVKARRTLQRRLLRAVSPRTAARYLQLESKIRAIEAYDIATSVPLIR